MRLKLFLKFPNAFLNGFWEIEELNYQLPKENLIEYCNEVYKF